MASFRAPLPLDPANPAAFSPTVETLVLPETGPVRYPGQVVRVVRVTAPATSTDLFPPVAGMIRDLGSIDGRNVIELSPQPLAIAPALAACRGGCPTFYLATTGTFAGAGPSLDGSFVRVASPAVSLIAAPGTPETVHAIGVVFQDRVSLEPWAWLAALDAAMQAAGDAAGDPDRAVWAALAGQVPGTTLGLVEAGGAPSTRELEARIGTGAWTAVPRTDSAYSVPSSPGPIEIRLASPPATARPMFSLYACDLAAGTTTTATAADDAEPATFTLPAGTRAAVLQVMDLDEWFAERPAVTPSPFAGWTPLARYHLGSRTEPVVDGNPAFERIVEDLQAAAYPDGGAHLAGLIVRDFAMVEGDEDTTITALLAAIGDASGTVPPYLVSKLLNLSDAQWEALHAIAAEITSGAGIALAGGSIFILQSRQLYRSCSAIAAILLAVVNLAIAVFAGTIVSAVDTATIRELVEGIIEVSKEAAEHLAAIWSRYPADLGDNPLGDGTLPLGLEAEIDHVGVWNQKLQLVRRHASESDATLEHVAWVGGLDIAPSRGDDPGHRGKPVTPEGEQPDWTLHPWHDVHARVTGAAASDLWKTWNERYEFEQSQLAAGDPPLPPRAVDPPPEPAALALPEGPHVVQIGRTYFAPGTGHTGLPFAPAGETTTNEALIKAILAARDYIYIEDQYFTPPGEPGDVDAAGVPNTIVSALIAAAGAPDDRKRLVIVVPSESDQPYGAIRRRYVFQRLREAWGERVVIGSPVRPPLLAAPTIEASEGRCLLLADLTEDATTAQLGPLSRLPPKTPFWLWIEGEVALCTDLGDRVTATLGDEGHTQEIAGIHVTLRRADGATETDPAGKTGGSQRKHAKGAPVTLSQIKGIYVHAKVMIVDDVFVAIGSSTLDRRGMFHDGHVTAFTVPRELLSAAENPARALRTALWAEHLGLPPEMGSPLLGDVPAAFALWKRAVLAGNRFAAAEMFLTRPADLSTAQLTGGSNSDVMVIFRSTLFALALAGSAVTAAELDELWRKVIDPTTSADPHPESTITP